LPLGALWRGRAAVAHALLSESSSVVVAAAGARIMTRMLTIMSLGLCVLSSFVGVAFADDLPVRKAGLWEIKMVRTGSPLPAMTMQHCTDETTDRAMNNIGSPMAKQVCSKQEFKKTATGYVSDSTCNVGGVS